MIVQTRYGLVEGDSIGNMHTISGIPYAAPPIGERRFKPPSPPEAWPGIREARRFGPSAPQWLPPEQAGKTVLSEDCLTLNVWTSGDHGAAKPVLVYIHGGAFKSGSGSEFDGRRLADQDGMVVVSVNYRLGALGFLYLGGRLGDDYRTSGNNGLLDILAALRWVRENIRAFGGDPERVTIAGSSAGAKCVGALLVSPAAEGLFHRAILQSGATQSIRDQETAGAITDQLLRELGLDDEHAHALLEVSAAELVAAQESIRPGFGGLHTFGPVMDGHVIPAASLEELLQRKEKLVPILIGANRDEIRMGVHLDPMLQRPSLELLHVLFGRSGEGVWQAFRTRLEAVPDQEREVWGQVLADYIYRFPAFRLAESYSQCGGEVFMYHFEYANEYGATHAYETHFVYDYTHADTPVLPESAMPLKRAMGEAWRAFVHAGKPAAADMPEWEPFDPVKQQVMILDRICSIGQLTRSEDGIAFPDQVLIL